MGWDGEESWGDQSSESRELRRWRLGVFFYREIKGSVGYVSVVLFPGERGRAFGLMD